MRFPGFGGGRPGQGARWIFWPLGLVLLALAAGLLANRGGTAGASALSASPAGLLAARTYLERSGTPVSLSDAPIEKLAAADALLLAFPASGLPSAEELSAMKHGLASGGTIVVAYSGRSSGLLETFVLDGLGLKTTTARGEPPLNPLRWWAFAGAQWRLRPEAKGAAAAASGPEAAPREIVIRAPDRIPVAPENASVLYRGDSGRPAVFTVARGRGRLVVLPADALSNGRLAEPGNADLLESLRASIPGRFVFDEYHHGLVAPRAAADGGNARSLDLLLLELALLYLLAALALGRRFGPAWEEPPGISGSAASFLFGLGALHRRLRHSRAASARLVETAVRLDPRVTVSPDLKAAAESGGEARFLELAKAVARSQRRWRYR